MGNVISMQDFVAARQQVAASRDLTLTVGREMPEGAEVLVSGVLKSGHFNKVSVKELEAIINSMLVLGLSRYGCNQLTEYRYITDWDTQMEGLSDDRRLGGHEFPFHVVVLSGVTHQVCLVMADAGYQNPQIGHHTLWVKPVAGRKS